MVGKSSGVLCAGYHVVGWEVSALPGSAGYNLNDISEVSEEDEADLGHLQSIRGEHLPSDHGDGSATSEPREEEISEYF